ncbi:MAG: hypothetical protein CW346_06685 [Bacillaceae bacterium]|nr:hypothetical protein [Bacillaceae bacterium]MBY6271882.1 hypothetical protein [Bacillaceae bacterium]
MRKVFPFGSNLPRERTDGIFSPIPPGSGPDFQKAEEACALAGHGDSSAFLFLFMKETEKIEPSAEDQGFPSQGIKGCPPPYI